MRSPYRPSEGRTGVEERSLPRIPAIIVCTEKIAAVCLLTINGRADYAGFFGTDSIFRKWATDVFLYFWNSGKRVSAT